MSVGAGGGSAGAAGKAGNHTVGLEDVCYRPFRDGACAVQSVAQYWQLNRQLYRQEQVGGGRRGEGGGGG